PRHSGIHGDQTRTAADAPGRRGLGHHPVRDTHDAVCESASLETSGSSGEPYRCARIARSRHADSPISHVKKMRNGHQKTNKPFHEKGPLLARKATAPISNISAAQSV